MAPLPAWFWLAADDIRLLLWVIVGGAAFFAGVALVWGLLLLSGWLYVKWLDRRGTNVNAPNPEPDDP